jgi:4-hydroxybenzoate polyprenyltransferase
MYDVLFKWMWRMTSACLGERALPPVIPALTNASGLRQGGDCPVAFVRANDHALIETEAAGNGLKNASSRTYGDEAAREGAKREIGQSVAIQLLIFFRATRPTSSFVAGAMSASILIAAQGRLSLLNIAAGLAMTALAMFGFVVNDVFDYDKDAVAGVRRPIASGELSIRKAVILASGLLATVFVLSAFVGLGGKVLAITTVGLVAYSPIAQRYPLSKGAFVAGLCCSPLLYGSVVGGIPCRWFSYMTLACFVFGRETLMDAEELIGDCLAGMVTIAAVLGYRRTRGIGVAIMFLSTICLVALARSNAGRIAASAMLLCLMCVFVWPGLSDATRIKLSRIPMLAGTVAIAIGSQ